MVRSERSLLCVVSRGRMKEMRKNGPMVNRWLYGLMCLLLVLNYGTPLMALAEDVNSDGQLTLGEVKQTSQQEMTLALQGKHNQ